VETGGVAVIVGDKVKIVETRPISKGKYFKIMEVIK
jgi:ribosomal protein S17